MKKFFSDFKAFALKGNVIDLAVAVVIGGAFGKIITSLVDDLIMPLISLIFKTDFSHWFVVLGGARPIPEELVGAGADALKEAGYSIFHYGNFISLIVNFIIIAFCIFLVVSALKKAQEKAAALKKKDEEPAEEKKPRVCPFCKMEIADDATRCPHCTSELPAEE